MISSAFRRIACAAIASVIFIAPAGAAIIEVGPVGSTVILNSDDVGTVEPLGPDSFQWSGVMTNEAMGWQLDWNLTIDRDPSITGVAAFTNLMGSTQNFTYNVSANSTEAIANPIVNGASTITVLDTNTPGNGATMAALSNDSIYRAFIQATTEQTLFNDPYSLVAGAQSVNSDGATWGPQAANVASLSIGDTFGINHDFSLTASDQATLNSSFFITPEPTSMLLVAFGVVAVLRRR